MTNTHISGTTNDELDSSNCVKTHAVETHDVEPQNIDTHNVEAPALDVMPPMQSVELTTASIEPECEQELESDDGPLNLSIQKKIEAYAIDIIDLSSSALDLSLKK